MNRASLSLLAAGTVLTAASVMAFAAVDTPTTFASINQNVDAATLQRYHYTDQGTRLIPAAWMAALETADGKHRFMSPENLRQFGFIVDNIASDPMNPYGWPVGLTVSDPKAARAVPVAGFTCAMCHTGELDYKGTAIRIEGGQAMIDLPAFVAAFINALTTTATDPSRRAQFFADAIKAGYPADRMRRDFESAIVEFGRVAQLPPGTDIKQLETGRGRLDAVQGIANQVFGTDLMVPTNSKDLDAPVNFPYLWDIWRLSWLQYNAFLPPLSTSRNIGEIVGSRGMTNIVNPENGDLNPEPLRWQTSIQLANIIWMENTLEGLHAPTWPADILGPIDQAKADHGKQLFTAHCAGCHGIKELPNGQWDVNVVPLEHIGTDPGQATNWAGRTYDATKIGLSKETPAFNLDIAINAIRKQLYVDNKTPAADQEPDVSFEAPCGYKARPLIGVWATPPFLHNGSVRTIFDLLSDTRPSKFTFGSREYDPVNLGYTEDQSLDTVVLDTSLPGNSNAGHWFTDDISRSGRIGAKFSDDDKYAIIEFLKAANYDNYPSEKRAALALLPCQDDKNWVVKAAPAAPK